MVVELVAGFRVAARVVGATPARRSLRPVVVGHVGLRADHRLDAVALALLVEVEDPVHVAVIGDAHRRLSVGDSPGDRLVEAGGAVEHRELGVDVEVRERIAHLVRTLSAHSAPEVLTRL